jgi:hypothetical protein
MQKELYGDRSESVIKSSNEAAIICNILSMSFLQKGEYPSQVRHHINNFRINVTFFRKFQSCNRASQKSRVAHRGGRQIQGSYIQQFCLHFQERKEAEIGPELPRESIGNRIQLSALQRGERRRLFTSAEPNGHPPEHLCYS